MRIKNAANVHASGREKSSLYKRDTWAASEYDNFTEIREGDGGSGNGWVGGYVKSSVDGSG